MTAQRPDLLPLEVPYRIGLDKHGLVSGGKLSGDSYPISAGYGEVRASAGTTTWPDEGDGFLPYALISGRPPNIGGQELFQDTYSEEWIYSDSKYSWVIRSALTHDWTTHKLTITVSLIKSFGVLGRKVTITPITLCSLTWQPQTYSGVPVTLKSGSTFYYHSFIFSHCLDGSIAVLNVGRRNSSSWLETRVLGTYIGQASLSIHDIVRIDISGDGDIDNNGAGIIGVIAIDKSATELLLASTSSGALTSEPDVTDIYSLNAVNNFYTQTVDPPPPAYPRTVRDQREDDIFWAQTGTKDNSKKYDDSSSTTKYLVAKVVLPNKEIKDIERETASANFAEISATITGGPSGYDIQVYVPSEGAEGEVQFGYTTGTMATSSGAKEITYEKDWTINLGSTAILSVSEYSRQYDDYDSPDDNWGWVVNPLFPYDPGVEGSSDVYFLFAPGSQLPMSFTLETTDHTFDGGTFLSTLNSGNVYLTYISGNVFGIMKVAPDYTASYEFFSIDGSTYDAGAGWEAGKLLTYHPMKKTWALADSAVYV